MITIIYSDFAVWYVISIVFLWTILLLLDDYKQRRKAEKYQESILDAYNVMCAIHMDYKNSAFVLNSSKDFLDKIRPVLNGMLSKKKL